MKLSLFQMLLLCIGFTFSLILFRIFYSESLVYLFFAWNLFLAVIPLVLSTFLIKKINDKIKWLLFTGWLLFFPNALYIITDLTHLKVRDNVPFWFDIILIFSAVINGLIMAYLSLNHVESFLQSKFTVTQTNLILSGCLFLSSFGVYLGRFLRLNSWDILINPTTIVFDIMHYFIDPFHHSRTWAITILFTLFFSIFYFTIKKITLLNNTQGEIFRKYKCH
jgi:uncharacterized membrane protein